ncbi:MAG: cytochrome c oxidase subunit II [Pseudomonadales bacterium]
MTSSMAGADWWDVNLREGVTAISRDVYDLHMTIFWVCVVIGVIVYGVMFVSMVLHRKSRGVQPATFHENTHLEIIWTVIPVLILIAIAWPATTTLRDMYDSGDSTLDIKVTGYQWKWQYTYVNDDPAKEVEFMSNMLTPPDEIENRAAKREYYLLDVDNPLVIPTDTRVRFLITSEDVIHSWWVPDFAIKKDAIPGFVHTAWTIVEEPGMYRGQCAELCGRDHAFMPVVVRAVPPDEYETWLAEQQAEARQEYETMEKEWTREELMAKGEEVYTQSCANCHKANGEGIPPAFPPLTGGELTTGPIEGHADIVLNGKSGTAMQAFGNQLSAAELAAVITYERNALGNSVGDMIQPKKVNEMLSRAE